MSRPHTHAVWDSPDRPAALAAAVEAHGEHGEKLRDGGIGPALAPSDAVLFRDPEWMAAAQAEFPAMFAQGLEGYTDDRIADGAGWASFDVTQVRCPVTVLHGGADRMVDVIHAQHTAALVPDARLILKEDLGHFSIVAEVIPAVVDLLSRSAGTE